MRSQSITLITALFGSVTAVPCSDFGMGGTWNRPGRPQTVTGGGLHPFDDQTGDQRWDVVLANDCYARWQPLRAGQSRRDARVTKTVFEATSAQVRAAMNNFFNPGSTNIQLWFPMMTKALQYTHMLQPTIEDHTPIIPQSSLSDVSRVIVSIILPSGAKKLEVVTSKSDDEDEDTIPPESNEGDSIKTAEDVGIVGLKGTIETGDWAYISGAELELAVKAIYSEQKLAFYSQTPYKQREFAYALAEKDNGDCVVIDFRDFPPFVLRVPPAAVR